MQKPKLYIPRLAKLKARDARIERRLDMFIALFMILLGLVTIVFYRYMADYLHLIVGLILFAFSGTVIFRYFHKKEYFDRENMDFMVASFAAVAAVLIISRPSKSLLLISVIWGACSVFKAIREINSEIQLRVKGERIFWKVVLSLFELVLGVILLLELNNEALGHHLIVLGISFISHGIKELNIVCSKEYERPLITEHAKSAFESALDKAGNAVDRVNGVIEKGGETKK